MTLRAPFTLLFLAALTCSASTVTYLGQVSGANDGQYFTGPSNLLVDGVPTIAVCLNFDIAVAGTWQSAIELLSDIPISDQAPFLQAEWLFRQFDLNAQIYWPAIHHAVWNLFGGAFNDGLYWDAMAAANYGSIDPATAAVLIPEPKRSSQMFLGLVTVPVAPPVGTPEPATVSLIGGALVGLSMVRRRRAK